MSRGEETAERSFPVSFRCSEYIQRCSFKHPSSSTWAKYLISFPSISLSVNHSGAQLTRLLQRDHSSHSKHFFLECPTCFRYCSGFWRQKTEPGSQGPFHRKFIFQGKRETSKVTNTLENRMITITMNRKYNNVI